MKVFIVLVSCLPHIKECPIPGGYNSSFKAKNIEQCEKIAANTISAFGYPPKDFKVECK